MDSDATFADLYPPDGPYQYAYGHAPYLDAVAQAVKNAGVDLDSWGAVAEVYRDGFLETSAFVEADNRGYCFRWTETAGWSYGYDRGDGYMLTLAYFGGEVLPSPDLVAATIARIMAGEVISDTAAGNHHGFAYREAMISAETIANDLPFERQLAAYRTHPGHVEVLTIQQETRAHIARQQAQEDAWLAEAPRADLPDGGA